MTLTELRYIVAVARERHFSRAAQSCFVSQPTLSVGVRKLEEELGVKIFERGAKNEVRPTRVGERIIEQAQRVLEETEQVQQIAQHGQDPLSGPLRLGVIYTIGPYLLPQLIPNLHRRAPKMPLMIEEGLTSQLANKLKQGELDVVILSLPFKAPGVVTQTVYREPFEVAMPADHPWVDKEAIDASSLAETDLLLLGPGHCFRDQVLQACPECNRSAATGGLQKTLESSSLETIRHMVASGAGVTVFPCTSSNGIPSEQQLLVRRSFKDPAPSRLVALAWRKAFPRPEAVEEVRRGILESEMPCVTMLPDEPILP